MVLLLKVFFRGTTGRPGTIPTMLLPKRWPLLALVGWHGPLAAQQFDLRVFGVESGLPSATVDAIREDSLGYLWVITTGGQDMRTVVALPVH